MAHSVHALYRWKDEPGETLERAGWISDARLRAWEYERAPVSAWRYANGNFSDTVRRWRTARPDLRVPEELLVGDYEEMAR